MTTARAPWLRLAWESLCRLREYVAELETRPATGRRDALLALLRDHEARLVRTLEREREANRRAA